MGVFSSLTNQFIDPAGISGIDAAPPTRHSTVGGTHQHSPEHVRCANESRTIGAIAIMTFYLYLLNIWTRFAPLQHHVVGWSIYPAARILKTEDVCFLLTATFLHIPCGIRLFFSHSLK